VSARVSLTNAIGLDPEYAAAHYQMARLLKATGEEAGAAEELERFKKYHDEGTKKGIIGLVSEGKWDYTEFLPSN